MRLRITQTPRASGRLKNWSQQAADQIKATFTVALSHSPATPNSVNIERRHSSVQRNGNFGAIARTVVTKLSFHRMKLKILASPATYILAAVIAGCGTKSGATQSGDTRLRKAAREATEMQVKERLKDPFSAKFRNVEFYGTYIDIGGGEKIPARSYTLCGEVNSKNSFGGYVGYARFISTRTYDSTKKTHFGRASLEEIDPDSYHFKVLQKDFDKRVADECKDEIILMKDLPTK